MQYPVPTYKETKALIKFYAGFRRSPKYRARAQLEYMKSILEPHVQKERVVVAQGVEGHVELRQD